MLAFISRPAREAVVLARGDDGKWRLVLLRMTNSGLLEWQIRKRQFGSDDGLLSVDGLVSGIKSHMIEAASKPTDATLRNVAAQSKFAATNPKSAALSAAPSPDAVPMMP